MKKVIFGIFAHPDDEAFGPAGALLQEVKSGAELHLITLTLGDAGTNPDNASDLAAVREVEWRKAGALIGAHSMHWLGYKDGQLGNITMIEAQQKLLELITSIIQPDTTEIEFITLDLNGLTGHIDHIVAARSASWAFYQLKQNDSRFTYLRYACLSYEHLPTLTADWIFTEAGRGTDEINQTIDARQYKNELIEIINCHHSQRADGESHIKHRGDSLGVSQFIVRE